MQKVALVTGANRGIGLEICRQLAENGMTVLLGARDKKKGKEAEALLKLSADVTFIHLDVTKEKSITGALEQIKSTYGKLDVLVNNAGIISSGKGLGAEDPIKVREVLETNLIGAINLTHYLLPLLKKSKDARIINVSSGMGANDDLSGNYGAYRLSKNALNAFTIMLADELNSSNTKVNSVCPGWVKTDMGGNGASRSVEKGAETITWLATLKKDVPTGKFFRDKQEIDF